VLAGLVVEVYDTSLGSNITLDRNDFTTHACFFGSGVQLFGGSLEHVLSTTIDDDLELARRRTKRRSRGIYLGTIDG
jgi:hypothetical protein